MGNFCGDQSASQRSQLEASRLVEVEQINFSRKNTRVSNLSMGSGTTGSLFSLLGMRKKIQKMKAPSAKIFTIRRPEFTEPVFDQLLADKYKKVPNGGPIVLEDKSTYQGQMKHRLRYGFGEQVYPDGSMYEGYFDNDKRNGAGRYFMADGLVYDGFWANDKMHGYGKLYFAENSYYEGSFEDGAKNGLGKLTLPDGSYYEGTWKVDRRVGEGWFYSAANKTKTLQIWSLDSTEQ